MSLVKHKGLKDALFQRWKELGWNATFICKDAKERGMLSITNDRLSRYKTSNKIKKTGKSNSLTDDQLLFLAYRCGIEVKLVIGTPVIDNGAIKYKILPYNEEEALKVLKRVFPNLK